MNAIPFPDFSSLYPLIGYQFKDESLLQRAMTHPSLSKQIGHNYERLEFLGDAVLSMMITERLLMGYPDEAEGVLAKKLAVLVSGTVIAEIARSINLGAYLLLSKGEINHGGRELTANLENAMEALIGAIYMDGGLDAVNPLIDRLWSPRIAVMTQAPEDPKTALQETVQAKGLNLPTYQMVARTGPSHAPLFTMQVSVDSYPPITAEAKSKRAAEREAAKSMLLHIRNQDQS